MANDSDAENPTIVVTSNEETPLIDEETPLLEDSQIDQQREQDDEEPKPEPGRASWWIWRVFWGMVTVLVLAAFIKGWIDAGGDVDVCSVDRDLQASWAV